MKEKIKKALKFILNPRLLLCVGIAWMITNGWSYVLFAVGTWLQNGWMLAVSGAYLAFLWLPISPEKIVTFAIAIALLRWLFPKDTATLAVLRELHQKAKNAVQKKKADKQKRKEEQEEKETKEQEEQK